MNTVLSPIKFRNGVTAKNRVALAAMTNSQSHADGTLSDEELRWLTMRAEGGFGLVSTCAAHVAKDGQGWPGEVGTFDDSLIPGLRRFAEAMHEEGALAFTQIFHGGLRADPKVSGERPWSATEFEGGPRGATEADIERVIGQYADAARRSHQAGLDGVEIHGAHGYLLTQFLSKVENQRTDAWGGSLENRARLMREVTRRVRAAVPASFTIGIRISPEDFGNAKGLDLDENLQLARWLVEDGIDFLHLSLWDVHRNSTKRPEVPVLPQFREVVPREVLLLVAGKIWSGADAEKVIEQGADLVALGRSAIANPAWAKDVADPAWEPRRPPLSPAELLERGLQPGFVEYMRNWKGFVSP